MAELKYNMLKFKDNDSSVRVIFLNRFYVDISKKEVGSIADFKLTSLGINFDCAKERAERRFLSLLSANMPGLRTLTTNNPAVYIHRNSNIPLIGNLSFGLVYRDTSIIEVKPQTGCNLNCIYCSVKEGLDSKQTDFFIEREYLVEEFNKLTEFIGEPVEAHIGVQGEPLLYTEFKELVMDLSKNPLVSKISTDTNGTLLTKSLIDYLSQYKLRFNISLNAIDQKIASRMAGINYNVKHVLDMIDYASKKMDILIAPLYLPGYNDEELAKIINFARGLPKKDHPMVCIQNFLNYKTGRNPVKMLSWEDFTEKLRTIEKATGERLILDFKKDFQVKSTKKLSKPFKKRDIVKATIVASGRYPNTMIAVAKSRNITIMNAQNMQTSVGSEVKLKILRSKHNIFFAKLA